MTVLSFGDGTSEVRVFLGRTYQLCQSIPDAIGERLCIHLYIR